MKKLQLTAIQLITLTAFFVIGAFGNTITLDTSFNGTGYTIRAAIPAPDYAVGSSMITQSDGKIVIGGFTSVFQFALMRINTDGSPDTSFGNGGTVLTTIEFSDRQAQLALQPDGKILLSGVSASNTTYSNFTIVRYNTNGSLDTSFNNTGYATVDINGSSFDESFNLTLQTDGKIILVGRTAQLPGTPDLHFDLAVMRFTTNGTPDMTFNGTGILTIDTSGADEVGQSVIVQPDGKILIGGSRSTNNSQGVLIRLNPNGSFDSSFGNGGMIINPVGSNMVNDISTLALQSDGKILAGGTLSIARYNTNGTLDVGFARYGVANTGIEIGKIKVITGDKFLVSASRLGVYRFSKDGEIDTTLQNNINIPVNSCFAPSIEIQSDGKIVFGGYCNQGGIPIFAAIRVKETVTITKRFLDFDGDGFTDLSVFRPSSGQWLYPNFNNQPTTVTFGTSTDRLIPADFTGDGRTDIAFFRPSTGEWFILRSATGTYYSFPFGTAGDIPIAADFDGDQIADPGVFRPSTNQWFIQKSTGGTIITTFGIAGDKLVPSDYDGDNKTDIAIYRPSSGEWWIQKSSDANIYAFRFGTSNDKPVPGDYTGDNKTDAAFWRPSTGEWFILRSEDSSYYSIPFGLSNDLPTPGNYAGDNRFDLVVFRPSTNTWHILPTGGSYFNRIFGTTGDQPIPNVFVP